MCHNAVRFWPKKKAKHTGTLSASLAAVVTDVFNDAITNTVEVGFEEYGRWLDMRKIDPAAGGEAYLEALAKWLMDKGLYQRRLARYLEKRGLVQADKNALKNMAWAVAKKRDQRPRARRWYNKSKGAIDDLFNAIAADLPQVVLDQLKSSFKPQ